MGVIDEITVFHMQDYEFVPRREFDEFAQLMELWLRIILEELEAEWGALAAKVECLQVDATSQSFQKTLSPDKSVGIARDAEKVSEDAKLKKILYPSTRP